MKLGCSLKFSAVLVQLLVTIYRVTCNVHIFLLIANNFEHNSCILKVFKMISLTCISTP